MRIQNHLELAFAHAFVEALIVSFLDAGEGSLAVRERHVVSNLKRQTHGGFHGAVPAANHQNIFVHIMIGFNQAVHDLGQLFAFDSELARATGLAESKDNIARAIAGLGGDDRKNTVGALVNILHLLAAAKPEIIPLQYLIPEGEKFFLGQLSFFEFAVHGKFHRAGHHKFLPRIFRHGAAKFALVQGDVIQFFLNRAQRGADSRWTCADNEDVIQIRGWLCAPIT